MEFDDYDYRRLALVADLFHLAAANHRVQVAHAQGALARISKP